jgi:hypothetical protein
MLRPLSRHSNTVWDDADHLTLTLQAPTLLDTRARLSLGGSERFGWCLVRCARLLVRLLGLYGLCGLYGLLLWLCYLVILDCMSYFEVYVIYSLLVCSFILFEINIIYIYECYVNLILVSRFNPKNRENSVKIFWPLSCQVMQYRCSLFSELSCHLLQMNWLINVIQPLQMRSNIGFSVYEIDFSDMTSSQSQWPT